MDSPCLLDFENFIVKGYYPFSDSSENLEVRVVICILEFHVFVQEEAAAREPLEEACVHGNLAVFSVGAKVGNVKAGKKVLFLDISAYKDKHEENHQPKLHGELVIKTNANQHYATNAVTAFIFREIAGKHNLPAQVISTCYLMSRFGF
ncbi:Peptidase M18 [Dillenia turbinata]|uniref:Peptidase M18 n=1 Tax=Dillenia turbinata TaxID=194707 RepID=A0AAN8VQ36_9MAGN